MVRARKCIAWLLLAFWPMAMLHCDLEAAGIDWPLLVHHDHDDAESHDQPEESSSAALHPSDDLGLQSTNSETKVRCPALWLVFEQAPLVLCVCERQTTSPPPRTDEPIPWVKSWRFEQRAAPLARAPGVRV